MPGSVRLLASLALGLVIALVAISSYIRLSHSGLGCPDWPQCYARIGQPHAVSDLVQTDKPGPPVQQPHAWAQPVHRMLASLLGLVVLGLLAPAWVNRKRWPGGRQCLVISVLLLALTLGLALLGLYSGRLHNPAIVMGNLGGGMLMIMALGWLVLAGTIRPVTGLARDGLRRGAWIVLLLVSMQIGLGGLTGANFAATACTTFPDCHGQWLPDGHLAQVLDLSRQIEANPQGYAIGGAERQAIHLAHRTGAWLLGIAALLLAAGAWRQGLRTVSACLVALLSAELAVGIAAVYMQLPIVLAVAHNWLAGLLLLCTLWLLALSREPGPKPKPGPADVRLQE